MKRVAIIGGGISGLSAAFYLDRQRRAGAELAFTLFEAGPRFGGVLRTESAEGCMVEAGPDSFLSEKPWASELCRDLGIDDQLIGSHDAQRKTFILRRGRLAPLPDGLQFMVPTRILPAVLTSLFSLSTKLRMAREYFAKPRVPAGDESVAAFVERHYGREVVERLADPLLAGVYGGDADHLSMRAVLPRMLDLEKKYGSLSRGMLVVHGSTPAGSRSLFTTLRGGMQQMADAILQRVDSSSLRADSPVERLRREGERWTVDVPGSSERFDRVIIAAPAYAAANLLRAEHAILAAELEGIPYSSSVTVALGFPTTDLTEAQQREFTRGFGFLVPYSEGRPILACIYVHMKFPQRVAEGMMMLRLFLGGARNPEALEMSDEQILAALGSQLQQLFGVTAEPRFVRIFRWPRAMAQYHVGHLDRLERIEQQRRSLAGLYLAGNAYRGIGVPDCIRSGREAADEIASG
jgi:oxygen-dependent protoporphyrinogen oxidase